MKKLLTSAIALSIVAGTPALAQPDNRRDKQEARQDRRENRQEARQDRQQDRAKARNNRGDRENRSIRSGNNPGQHRGWANNPDNRAAQMARGDRQRGQERLQDRRDGARQDRYVNRSEPRQERRQDRRQDMRQQDRRQPDRLRDRRNDVRQDRRSAAVERRWDRQQDRRYYENRWNRRARNFDSRAYRRAFVSPRRYRVGPYYRPSGWYYRRWGPGAYLPRLFWSSNYYLDSWWSYGLMSPPWGYEWVRYGPDAVLVDVRTGMILQVRYNVFW